MEGVLVASGELGYREASVRAILDYSGGHRAQFYSYFTSKDDCFAKACEAWMERLGANLLGAAISAGGWQAGVLAALTSLFEFAAERPAIARALFVETQVAGGAALATREAAMERLAAAMDSVRGEIEPGQAPPEGTGVFVVGGIDACVCEVLATGDPEQIWDTLPELMHLAVGSYLGKEAGEAAAAEARAAIEARQRRSEEEEG